jgi:hypothetical protein
MDRFELPIYVDRGLLMTKLRDNLAEHRAIFNRAIEKFRVEAVRQLNKRIDEIASGESTNTLVHLPVPEDHSADYERAIRMLEHHQRDEVQLTEATYRQFFDDDWDWKERWRGTTASYVGD